MFLTSPLLNIKNPFQRLETFWKLNLTQGLHVLNFFVLEGFILPFCQREEPIQIEALMFACSTPPPPFYILTFGLINERKNV